MPAEPFLIMSPVQVDKLRSEKYQYGYELKEIVMTAGETTQWVLHPAGGLLVNVALIIEPGQGTGYIETTGSTFGEVVRGVAVARARWPIGDATVSTTNILYPVTAFRAICTSGTVKFSAVAR